MKLTRKLIPAFAMLLVSAVLMSTASFAWFAMRDTVTASGMEVTASSDTIFLEIKGTEDTDYSEAGTNDLDATLKPVAHENWDDLADITDFDLVTAETYDNWYYQYSDKVDDHDSNLTPKQYISAFTNYVAVTTYSVKVTDAQTANGYDLYVSAINIEADAGIKVIIAGANGYQEFSAANNSTNIAFNADNILSDTVSTSAQTISVYIYIDGNDANVFTNNVANLTGAVTFSLKAFPTDH